MVFAILKIPKDHLALRLSRSYPNNIRAGYELRTENNGGGGVFCSYELWKVTVKGKDTPDICGICVCIYLEPN